MRYLKSDTINGIGEVIIVRGPSIKKSREAMDFFRMGGGGGGGGGGSILFYGNRRQLWGLQRRKVLRKILNYILIYQFPMVTAVIRKL